tara:strand:+ start:278 stop:739 length:462 start_codon:yes stop_codon:yes gene_type:complete
MPNKHIDLFKEMMPALDAGIKDMWEAAGEEGQKEIKGDLWNLNRYMSSVTGSRERQELAVFKTNEYYNKNWAVLGAKHPKLQWLLLCQAGNTGRKEFHPWIGFKKKVGNNAAINLLKEIYPNMKIDEVELLARISTKKELKQLAEEHDIVVKL